MPFEIILNNNQPKNTGNMRDLEHSMLDAEKKNGMEQHISRMTEGRLVRRVHDGIPVGKRNRGRPMKRWRYTLV
jgi:hypothetical protein